MKMMKTSLPPDLMMMWPKPKKMKVRAANSFTGFGAPGIKSSSGSPDDEYSNIDDDDDGEDEEGEDDEDDEGEDEDEEEEPVRIPIGIECTTLIHHLLTHPAHCVLRHKVPPPKAGGKRPIAVTPAPVAKRPKPTDSTAKAAPSSAPPKMQKEAKPSAQGMTHQGGWDRVPLTLG